MNYMLKPLSYVMLIVLGYLLRRAGFFSGDDCKVLSRIMINITLPCAIVQAFDGFERSLALLAIVGVGFLCALLPMLYMYVSSRGRETALRVYRMLNIGGYNIGCFSMPLIEVFFGSAGMVAACMFDMGNAIVVTGGAYAMTSTLLKTGGGEKEGPKDIVMKFLRSAPFDAYLVLLTMAALDIPVPRAVFELTLPASKANAFIAMLLIGVMFEPAGDAALLRETARQLVHRYVFAAVFALLIYFCTPFDLLIRQTLAVVCFAPLSSLAPVYTGRCHGDEALSSFTNSASIAVSLVCMLALSMAFMG